MLWTEAELHLLASREIGLGNARFINVELKKLYRDLCTVQIIGQRKLPRYATLLEAIKAARKTTLESPVVVESRRQLPYTPDTLSSCVIRASGK